MKEDRGAFTDLNVYKKCRKFRIRISTLTKEYFPKREERLLTNQIIRSSRSVTANISEGHGKGYFKEEIRFCRIARGSLQETLEHLITAYDEKYISVELLKELQIEYENCIKLLNGYIRYLKNNPSKEF